MAALIQSERASLLSRAWDLAAQLYPDDPETAPRGRPASLLRESYYRILGEYADRLPRVLFSACPFTGAPFKHSFDPFGFDGPWWHMDREVEIEEPAAPETFKVMLGAVSLRNRQPTESRDPVLAGPDVPFVVPRLLELPGMVAVISQLSLVTGDTAYPIVYYSQQEIPPKKLHQPWLEQDLWYDIGDGKSAWLIANDVFDFNLQPWIAKGKVRWIAPGDAAGRVRGVMKDEPCPYVDLPGERLPQNFSGGERSVLELPDGTPINPYEE